MVLLKPKGGKALRNTQESTPTSGICEPGTAACGRRRFARTDTRRRTVISLAFRNARLLTRPSGGFGTRRMRTAAVREARRSGEYIPQHTPPPSIHIRKRSVRQRADLFAYAYGIYGQCVFRVRLFLIDFIDRNRFITSCKCL